MTSRLNGLLNLHKPAGITSRDVVDRVTRLARQTKIGHAGTLDPLATGVLVVCVGAATRLIEYVQRMPKTYRTVIRLGARSDTLDADGRIEVVEAPRIPTLAEARAALEKQVGTIAQQPPVFSALKVGGRRAYELARAGQEVDLAPRLVAIHRIDLLAFDWPRLELEIACGSGTYIRSIARDVGEALGCGGLVDVLVRTRIGGFGIHDALDPEALTAESLANFLRSPLDAVADLVRLTLSAAQLAAVAQGKALPLGDFPDLPPNPGEAALVGPDGELAAIAEIVPGSGFVFPRRVLILGGN